MLTWREPENDGGSEIQGYYVERIQGAHSSRWMPVNRTPVSSCKYEFRVSYHSSVFFSSVGSCDESNKMCNFLPLLLHFAMMKTQEGRKPCEIRF